MFLSCHHVLAFSSLPLVTKGRWVSAANPEGMRRCTFCRTTAEGALQTCNVLIPSVAFGGSFPWSPRGGFDAGKTRYSAERTTLLLIRRFVPPVPTPFVPAGHFPLIGGICPSRGRLWAARIVTKKRYSHPISMGREHRCFVVPPRFRGDFPPLCAACFGAASGDFGAVRLIRALGGCPSRPLPQGAFSNCSPL